MAYLLDTHVFLWYLLGDPRLSRRAREIVEAKIDLYFSIAGLWEIAIKLNAGKLQIRRSLQELYDELGLINAKILPIEPEDTITYVNLPLPSATHSIAF
jgi:PIN domain nuclease of toxin-antitoxin system